MSVRTPGVPHGYRAGDAVRVRSVDEILATLDERGCLDGLPFMPEMVRFCGQATRVGASAHKTCDTVNSGGARQAKHLVHLEDQRCDGRAHGGCQAECLLFWHEAWLEPTDAPPSVHPGGDARATLETLQANTTRGEADGETIYSCQATRLLDFTDDVNPLDPRPFVRDWTSRNASLATLIHGLFFRLIANTIRFVGYRALIGLYDRVQGLFGGIPFPVIRGKATGRTPLERLHLKPGETVRVRSLREIEETIDERQRNRGLRFDWEMVNHCDQERKVHSVVERIINEKSGKMMEFGNPCIVLEGGTCPSRFSDRGRVACPRAIHAYWRENWLERVDEPDGEASS